MGIADYALLALIHPVEFRSLIQYKLWHEQQRDLTATKEHANSGWDRATMRECWDFLDRTSRSFAAVIKQLDGDLARTICLFYLVLRGLDTIEDDMTIPDAEKQPILRNFHNYLSQPGWTFDKNGPNEKDRDLLVRFHIVITELDHLQPQCKAVIVDICEKMQRGMADFAHKATLAAKSSNPDDKYVQSIEEFDLYCHYVAGLVGEGLSRLFAASGKEASWIADQLVLSNSMGSLLQKTNILRDLAEDVDEGRYFWPKEIWGAYGFKELAELKDPANQDRALWALSGMTLDTLRHVTDSLDYLTLLKNQSVFNFCAIPAVMALATLDVCFMNPAVLVRNVKIRKGQAVRLIMDSTNPRDVASICRDYVRSIHHKISPQDPNFMKLSIMCGRVEQWVEHHYPSIISVVTSQPEADGSRSTHAKINPDEKDARLRILKREVEIHKLKLGPDGLKQGARYEQEGLPKELYLVVFGGLLVTCLLGLALVYGVVFLADWLDEVKV
ncbi:bifunctional farnesyl-diphosphate farnesyltransferase/squalene synthase [Tulasnella sp. 408]|nr:bifunctional farnesyl-diphosphate farnesyltransferase/squalene synthase [Tulasnella sp. 408]